MDIPRKSRPWLVGLAAGMLIALLAVPATRWLIRMQLGALLSPPRSFCCGQATADRAMGVIAPPQPAEAVRHMAEHHPNDTQVQIAAAIYGADSSQDKVARLRALAVRYPDRAAIYATILRFASQYAITGCHRDEENLLTSNETVREAWRRTPSADVLAAWDRDAVEGERLDPDNCYFPLMRALGLFAAHRDDEGLAAIHRAGKDSHYENYVRDELNGRFRIEESLRGSLPAMAKVAIGAAVLLPHLAAIRSDARVSAYLAISAEADGRVADGLTIRHDLMRAGGLMRTDGRSVIDALVGIAIGAIATMRPGGISYHDWYGSVPNEQRAQFHNAQYYAYLNRIGRPDEAAWAGNELDTGLRVHETVRRGLNVSLFDIRRLVRLVAWWAADLALLTNALWMLLLGGSAALLARTRRFRTGRPLAAHARWAIAAAIVLATAVALVGLFGNSAFAGGALFATVAALVAYIVAAAAMKSRAMWRGLACCLITLAVLGLVGALAASQAGLTAAHVTALGNLLGNMRGALRDALIAVSFPAAVIVPLLALVVFSIISLKVRVPASVGMVRGFRGLAVPAACVLLLIYGPLAAMTLRQEAAIDQALTRTMQHEGRYLAELTDEQWPGPPAR